MRRRELPEDPSRPPAELLAYRSSDWWAPELDPPRSAWSMDRGTWSAVQAFRRYMNAKTAWEADHGKIRPLQDGFAYPSGWHELVPTDSTPIHADSRTPQKEQTP